MDIHNLLFRIVFFEDCSEEILKECSMWVDDQLAAEAHSKNSQEIKARDLCYGKEHGNPKSYAGALLILKYLSEIEEINCTHRQELSQKKKSYLEEFMKLHNELKDEHRNQDKA